MRRRRRLRLWRLRTRRTMKAQTTKAAPKAEAAVVAASRGPDQGGGPDPDGRVSDARGGDDPRRSQQSRSGPGPGPGTEGGVSCVGQARSRRQGCHGSPGPSRSARYQLSSVFLFFFLNSCFFFLFQDNCVSPMVSTKIVTSISYIRYLVLFVLCATISIGEFSGNFSASPVGGLQQAGARRPMWSKQAPLTPTP